MRPYGYAEGGVVAVPDEVKVVRQAAAELLAGDTLTAVVDRLNDAGVPTVTGAKWSRIALRRILTNPRIIGKRMVREQLVPAEPEPILPDAQWRKLQTLLLDPERKKFSASRKVTLLSGGVARCGLCRKQLYFESAIGRPDKYACQAHSGGCRRIQINAVQLDEAVGHRVVGRLADTSRATQIAAHMLDRGPFSAFEIASWWANARKEQQRDLVEAVLDVLIVEQATPRRGKPGIDLDRLVFKWNDDRCLKRVAELFSPAAVPA